jgi:hypothetical protein
MRERASGTATIGGNVVTGTMKAQEFRHGVKQDLSHYAYFSRMMSTFQTGTRNSKQQPVCIIHILSWIQLMFQR